MIEFLSLLNFVLGTFLGGIFTWFLCAKAWHWKADIYDSRERRDKAHLDQMEFETKVRKIALEVYTMGKRLDKEEYGNPKKAPRTKNTPRVL